MGVVDAIHPMFLQFLIYIYKYIYTYVYSNCFIPIKKCKCFQLFSNYIRYNSNFIKITNLGGNFFAKK